MNLHRARHRRSIYLKQCPRCGGDLGVKGDQYGDYISCLQCGYSADIGGDAGKVAELRMTMTRNNVA